MRAGGEAGGGGGCFWCRKRLRAHRQPWPSLPPGLLLKASPCLGREKGGRGGRRGCPGHPQDEESPSPPPRGWEMGERQKQAPPPLCCQKSPLFSPPPPGSRRGRGGPPLRRALAHPPDATGRQLALRAHAPLSSPLWAKRGWAGRGGCHLPTPTPDGEV